MNAEPSPKQGKKTKVRKPHNESKEQVQIKEPINNPEDADLVSLGDISDLIHQAEREVAEELAASM